MRVTSVVGTRPNFVKLAPVARALEARAGVVHTVVHTGQHSARSMDGDLWEDLALRSPEVRLPPMPALTPAARFGRLVSQVGAALRMLRPDWVLVYGDVDSTLAAAMAASKLELRVAHVEAGLRSYDWRMQEERNRVLIDATSTLLFAPTEEDAQHVRDERAHGMVHVVGNVMIDSIVAADLPAPRQQKYALVTLHRPQNVDDPVRLSVLVNAVCRIAAHRPVRWPLHPRTEQRLTHEHRSILQWAGVRVSTPMSYHRMLETVQNAEVVITDSGGVQEETTYLGVSCVTVRRSTERPITLYPTGTNRLVDDFLFSADAIVEVAETAMRHRTAQPPVIPLWDGRTAERIADVLESIA